jgi:uroporphyrinogen decarboxylase
MTSRELFREIMFYGDFDRMPVWHWAGWPETEKEWEEQGLEPGQNRHEYFNAGGLPWGVPVNLNLYPAFPTQTIEETPEYRIIQQGDGVIAKHWKDRSCIPQYLDFILTNRQAWEEQYKEKLQPNPARIASDFDAIAERMNASNRPLSVGTGSLVGWLRDWMGVVNFSYLQFDDPELLAEMVDTISDLVCWSLDIVLPKVQVDMGWGWEDICGSSGPLISPEIFNAYVVPGYRKIADKLLEHGVQLYVVDSDGLIDDLLPGWFTGGVNVMFPVQIQPMGADPMAFRRQYGKGLRIIGGIDKLVLTQDEAAIDAEIERRLPLMREGGFVPLPDHLIVPGTPLKNYVYYLNRLRELRF